MQTFLGYPRPDGSAGIRNWVLILPAQREVNLIAFDISKHVLGTKVILTTGEGGRPKQDRETIARTLVGLALNPNTAAILIIGGKPGAGYPELHEDVLAEKISPSGKPMRVITMSECGGYYSTIAEGIRLARELVVEASKVRPEPCPVSKLCIGVKCGMSDPTSGIAGNPVVGKVFDRLVKAGGTALFSETTELIGAEHLVAKRGRTPEVGKAILKAVEITEEKAKATGEDIRSINPIPANIAAGLTTLEEKSLGAIAKSGSSPIEGVLAYAERPRGHGLYFVDAWMSSLSLPLAYAASGAQLVIYQMGGGDLPGPYPAMPAVSSGIVSPLMYATGNPHTYEKAKDSIDFNSGTVLEGKETVEQAADRLWKHIIGLAEGSLTKMEVLNHIDPVEILLEGPAL
jgi:altronate dehydratase large subunit